ncbi:hypothetical protein [Duganella sp. HH101]|uniref:hypothetical protein n=1 Tax=Duganella sp. HH101 TaxID=1781066 RepID=UPI00114CB6F1|nr:hypothetical protein [Duganella sp. HH101]
MSIHIYREGGKFRLIPELLARQLRIVGVVVFTSGRVRQRTIARQVMDLVSPDIEPVHGESQSINGCMCIIDTERYSLREILLQVAAIDEQSEQRLEP